MPRKSFEGLFTLFSPASGIIDTIKIMTRRCRLYKHVGRPAARGGEDLLFEHYSIFLRLADLNLHKTQ